MLHSAMSASPLSAEAVLALALRDPAEPIALGEVRAAAETLEKMVTNSLCEPRAVHHHPASPPAAIISDAAGRPSPRTSPVECLRLLAEVWRHPILRGVVSQRFLTQELGALIRVTHEANASAVLAPGTRPVADRCPFPLEQPGEERMGVAAGPTPAADPDAATGEADAASGAAGCNTQPRDRNAPSDAGADGGSSDAAISDAKWARGRLSCLLANELLIPLLEALVPLVRSADGPPWLRGHASRCLCDAVQRQGGAEALLLCLQDSSGAAGGVGHGTEGAQPTVPLAVRLLSTLPRGARADDYFRGMGAQAAELLLHGAATQKSREAGAVAHYLRGAGAQLCAAIASSHPEAARRWLLAPMLAPLLPRAGAGSPCSRDASALDAPAEAMQRLHALLCAAPPPPRLCDALLASGALTALLAPAAQSERMAGREALSRLLLGATDPAAALEALLLDAPRLSASPPAHTGASMDLLRRVRAELRPPSLRCVAASLVVCLLRHAILATGAAAGAPAPHDLEWLHTCMVRPRHSAASRSPPTAIARVFALTHLQLPAPILPPAPTHPAARARPVPAAPRTGGASRRRSV